VAFYRRLGHPDNSRFLLDSFRKSHPFYRCVRGFDRQTAKGARSTGETTGMSPEEELRDLVREAISIVEAFDPNCDWLNEAKEILDEHRALAAAEKQSLGARANSLWMWAG
jgi:hypothetical protein